MDKEFGEAVIKYEKRRLVDRDELRDFIKGDKELEETLFDIFNGDYTLDAFRQDYENWLVYNNELEKQINEIREDENIVTS
jgi:hypothetical protein